MMKIAHLGLERIRDAAFSLERKSEVGIIICSALKRKNTEISFVKEMEM